MSYSGGSVGMNEKPATETEDTARAALLQASADASRRASAILTDLSAPVEHVTAAAELLKWGSSAFDSVVRPKTG